MKISAGSSRIGGPLCLYDENDDPIALMSDKLANKERVALDIVEAVNGKGWQPIETAPLGEYVLLNHPLWRCPMVGRRTEGRWVMLASALEGPDVEAVAHEWHPLPVMSKPATTGTAAGNPR